MSHRSAYTHRHPVRASRARDPLPFFQFMLFGAAAFAGASTGVRLVPVTRGRSLTLVRAPLADDDPDRVHRGA